MDLWVQLRLLGHLKVRKALVGTCTPCLQDGYPLNEACIAFHNRVSLGGYRQEFCSGNLGLIKWKAFRWLWILIWDVDGHAISVLHLVTCLRVSRSSEFGSLLILSLHRRNDVQNQVHYPKQWRSMQTIRSHLWYFDSLRNGFQLVDSVNINFENYPLESFLLPSCAAH